METTAHGLNATIAGTTADRRRASLRQSGRRRTAPTLSGSTPTAPPPVGLPGLPSDSPVLKSDQPLDSVEPRDSSDQPLLSDQQDSCSPFSYAARLALAPDMAPAAAVLPRPLVRPTLRAVKVEMSSSSSSASSDDDDDDKTASAAVVLDGYSSSSTLDDLSSATERQDCSCFVKEARTLQQQQQQQMVPFDRDDDDACDNLLLDILSGDGQGQDGHDGFFSLLADDMVVDPSCSGSQTAPEPLQGLNCFVKEEAGF